MKVNWKGVLSYVLTILVWSLWGLSHGPLKPVAPYLPMTLPLLVTAYHWLGVSSPQMPPLLAMLRKGPSVIPAIFVMGVFGIGAAACPLPGGGSGGSGPPQPPTTVKDVGKCVLDTVSLDLLTMGIEQAFVDAEQKCFGGLSADNRAAVEGLWTSHLAAVDRMKSTDAGGQ